VLNNSDLTCRAPGSIYRLSSVVRRVFEILRGKAERRGRMLGSDEGKRGLERSSLPADVVISHESACIAGRRRGTIYIFIPRGRFHRIDGKRRDALSSATRLAKTAPAGLFRDRGLLIGPSPSLPPALVVNNKAKTLCDPALSFSELNKGKGKAVSPTLSFSLFVSRRSSLLII